MACGRPPTYDAPLPVSNRQDVVRLSFRSRFRYISQLLPSDCEGTVKADIHPEYATATVRCACGNTFQTRSTQAVIHTDICGTCHPFFSGKQKLIDTAGRVERFRQKYSGNKPGKTT